MKRSGLALLLAASGASLSAATLAPSPARASVSIAVSVEGLVKQSTAVAIVTATEAKNGYEGSRIFTYTHVKVDRPIAGDLGTGADAWIRSEGGIVDHIGMRVDGEPALAVGSRAWCSCCRRGTGRAPCRGCTR